MFRHVFMSFPGLSVSVPSFCSRKTAAQSLWTGTLPLEKSSKPF